MAKMVQVTRVVETARSTAGRSTIGVDRVAPTTRLPTGRALAELWGTDRLLELAAKMQPSPGIFPAANGARLWVLVIPPDRDSQSAGDLHATDTLDLGFVLQGTVNLEMADGTISTLHQGDAFVQTGTAHRWINEGSEPAALGIVVIGTGHGHVASGDHHTPASHVGQQ
ncbi:cupin domain-containing protein [Mycobacterium sp. Aquia_216]|uniref:cupin domain-containing protein n=1 Tax=Mycobacterium sp. Aquia_216 TaxID=2991729 RepID=UPI00227C44D8|nr:cupin domain-containing protein [Mycobacterium sp. Aquia_216]WAJ44263.1 cupin domain-containing protein [Mycobacterium sp. Aquia_216]